MNKRMKIVVIIIVFFSLIVFITPKIIFGDLLFDQIPYNYISYVSIPPNSENENSISGYYKIWGKGHDFNFNIMLLGAEDKEDPLCYTKEGLNGTGRLNNMEITFPTIMALLQGNFKNAIFNAKFDGAFDMKCAAWTGYGNFSNNGNNFPGNFKIDGPETDWEGIFNINQENNRIALKADYIFYPHAHKTSNNIKEVKKTYYM